MKTCQDNKVWHLNSLQIISSLVKNFVTMNCRQCAVSQFRWNIWSANQNTTSQIVINWQQRWTLTVCVEWYKTDFNVSENENVHINSSRLVLCVRSYHDLPHLLPLRGCVQPIKWNLTFSIFGNVYSRTVFGPTQHHHHNCSIITLNKNGKI